MLYLLAFKVYGVFSFVHKIGFLFAESNFAHKLKKTHKIYCFPIERR